MKRFIYISLLCAFHYITGMDALWIDEEDRIVVSPFTKSIHQRYYYLARLNAVHQLIESLHCSCIVTYQDYQSLSQLQPQHPRILSCIDAMQQDLTCAPLMELWQEISSYKYLEDDQLIREYTTLICVLVHQLVSLLGEKLSSEGKKTLTTLMTKSPASTHIHSHEVAYRYYLIKRLKKVDALMRACSDLVLDYTICTHLPTSLDCRILQCAKDIETTKCLKPLVTLFEELAQFQSITDSTFMYDIFTLVLVIEQHVLLPTFLPRHKDFSLQYEHDVDTLSIEELLKSIDILTAHIVPYAITKKKHCPFTSIGAIAALMGVGILSWLAYQTGGVGT